jgi:excisionase family DNA binding protein
MSDDMMKVVDVAAYLNVSRTQVYILMGRGDLPWVRVGAARRIRRSDLVAFCDKNYTPAKGGMK